MLADVLQFHAPNVLVNHGKGNSTWLLQSPRCMVGGPPQVFIDGVPIAAPPPPMSGTNPGIGPTGRGFGGGSDRVMPFDLSQFKVMDFAGVEWYPDNDQAPIEFAHTSQRCGALLLWTRER